MTRAPSLFPSPLVGGEAETGEALLRPAERHRPCMGRWPARLGERGAFDAAVPLSRWRALFGFLPSVEWGRLPRDLLFFACAKKSRQKKAHPVRRSLRDCPAMLGLQGALANSAPYRRLKQALAVIPLEPCASRRLSRGPESKAVDGSLLRNIAPAQPACFSRWAARSAVLLMSPPLRGAEKRRSRGVWKRPTVRSAYRALSSDASPRLRASQGTRAAGAEQGVLSLAYFYLHKQREVGPAEGDPDSNPGRTKPSAQARSTKRPAAKSPPPLAPPRKGEGDISRGRQVSPPCT